ncbi:hypothetical protein TNCV_3164311 [Trichonephila clavipes]|nr:hypothetical protein TNCV_3164311 [Trichonephila clavipes]
MMRSGSESRVVKVLDRGWPCHEFEPSTTKDPPCRAVVHVKSVESSNALPLFEIYSRLGGVVGLSLATQGRGFDPGSSRWIFMMQKIDSGYAV